MDPRTAYYIIINGTAHSRPRRFGHGFPTLQRAMHALRFFRRELPPGTRLSIEEERERD
jgi:hypothetical protein